MRNRILALTATAYLMAYLILISLTSSAYGQPQEQLTITKVNSPGRVILGKNFYVNITVSYRFSKQWRIVVDVFDPETEKFVTPNPEAWAVTDSLTGQGSKTYNVTVVNPRIEKVWKLLAVVGILGYEEEGRYAFVAKKEFTVTITSKVRLTLTLEPPIDGVAVIIDGKSFATGRDGSVSIELSMLTAHAVEVPAEHKIKEGSRAIFVEWQDGVRTNRRTDFRVEDDTILAVKYKIQHLLTVESKHSSPTGGGWYDEGTAVTFSVTSPVPMKGILGQLGGKYVFVRWEGDLTETKPTATILMDGPKKVTAVWASDYTTVYAIVGGIVGAGAIGGGLVLLRKRRMAKVRPPYGPPTAPPVYPPAPPTAPPPAAPPGPPVAPPPPRVKFCISCGRQIPEPAVYCPICGTKQLEG